MPDIVEVDQLAKRYGERVAVSGVSFRIREGEVFGLLGPNGAGKTTTLSMIATLVKPSGGTLRVHGIDVAREPARVRPLIGLVPQEIALYPTLSARDNLAFFGRLFGLAGAALRRRVEEALALVGLTERGDDAVQEFSGGMKRRVNLAAGLLHRPRLLVLDEPTAGVDPQSRSHLFDNIERLSREGMTVLLSTHLMTEAERLCHRVGILDRGQLIALDTPQGLIGMLGGGVVHLRLKEASPPVIERLKAVPQIRAVRSAGGVLVLETEGAALALGGILGALAELRQELLSLKVLEPDLESVFLHLTGKSLRD